MKEEREEEEANGERRRRRRSRRKKKSRERVRMRKPIEMGRRHGGGGDKSNLIKSRTNLRLN